jgi:hypothetical protein
MDTENITTSEQEQVIEAIEAPKKVRMPRVGGFINSPWVLILVPLMAGAVWLAGNTWVITQNLNKPYALLAGPALAGSILALWLTIKFFQSIMSGGKAAWQAFQNGRKEDGSAQFFWLVIIVFMVVSVFASGSFFTTIEHDAVPGLGYATALFIDLVAVQSMRARLNAVRMRDKKGSRLYLFGVLVCAGASAFANTYTSLADFKQTVTGVLPGWMLSAAPWFGLVFPALILLLSMTADYTLDQISTKLDPEQYKAQESKRTKLLEYQVEALQQRVEFEQQIDQLTTKLRNTKERRVFFLINWIFPLRQRDSSAQIEELRASVDERLAKMGEYFVTSMQQMYSALNTSIDSQKDTDLSLIVDRITASQKATIEMVQHQINQVNDQTISLIQRRLNESHESVISECLSRIPMRFSEVFETDDEHPFSREDEMQMDGNPSDVPSASENTPESADREVQKARRSTKSAGYQIEHDPAAREVVQNYPNVERWLSIGAKSASLKEIEEVTEHSHRMVTKRFADGTLKRTSRNQNAITMESVIKWLSTAPLPKSKSADREESNQTIDVPQTPSIDVQSSDVLDDTQTDEKLTNTDEFEVIVIDENVEFDPDSNDGFVDSQEDQELAEVTA